MRQIILRTARCLILMALLSFLGWLYEVLLVRIKYGHWSNRGFLFLPFCPIYGVTLVVVYCLIGTPKNKHGVLKNIQNPYAHTLLYLLFAFIIPTMAELCVGMFFDKTFHLSLWSYRGMALNFHGYISFPVSLFWAALIYFFMRFFFMPLKKFIAKIPAKIAVTLATVLLFSVVVDVIIQFIKI